MQQPSQFLDPWGQLATHSTGSENHRVIHAAITRTQRVGKLRGTDRQIRQADTVSQGDFLHGAVVAKHVDTNAFHQSPKQVNRAETERADALRKVDAPGQAAPSSENLRPHHQQAFQHLHGLPGAQVAAADADEQVVAVQIAQHPQVFSRPATTPGFGVVDGHTQIIKTIWVGGHNLQFNVVEDTADQCYGFVDK